MNSKPKMHTRDGWMTPEYHAEYMLAIKPLTDLYGTEHDLWATGVSVRNPVWEAAELQVRANMVALDERYDDGDDEDDGTRYCPTCGHLLDDEDDDD